MTKVEAIIRPNKFESVKTALIQLGVEGMTVSEVRGHGRQKGHTEVFKGREYEVDLLPKIKLELVLQDEVAEKAVETILATAYTGSIGDGKIFMYKLSDAIRIRSRERGQWRQFSRPFVTGTQGDSYVVSACRLLLRGVQAEWESGKGMRLTEQICNVSQFLCRFRVQMRYGELTRAPLKLLRLEVLAESVECDWLARPQDPWDADLPAGVGLRHASLQTLRDAIDMRSLRF